MSEPTLDEGLDEILRKHILEHDCAITIQGIGRVRDTTKQAILDLMCKHRGCKLEGTRNIFHPELGSMEKRGDGPCIWCGKEQC